jgi:lipopolysaccharide export system permease protein
MMRWLLRPLDRYVLSEFVKIFVTTALGFPFLLTIIDLTDNLDKYLNRNLPRADIALSYVFWIPENMSMVLPAATLFAAVFSIGAFTRHSEITAAKASGISFHRLALPIFFGAVGAAALTLGMGELAPNTNRRRAQLLQEVKFTTGAERYNFAFAAERGRVYKIATLQSDQGTMSGVQIERRGLDEDASYPTYILAAETAKWTTGKKGWNGWTLRSGTMHVLPSNSADVSFRFDSLRDRHFEEPPKQLLGSATAPQEMRYQELGKYIAALERSGGNANELRVERSLKLAIPVTCIIIAFFGAPLATSTRRGGAAYGIAISLATTITFLVLIQLTKAVGQKGVIQPELAAWLPNMVFGAAALVLLFRVRT